MQSIEEKEKQGCKEDPCKGCGWCCRSLGKSVDLEPNEEKELRKVMYLKTGVVYLRKINAFFLSMTPERAETLKAIAENKGIKIGLWPNKFIYDAKHDKVIVYDYYLDHNQCPFYCEEEKNCTIYEDRPNSCRKYPNLDSDYTHEVQEFVTKHDIQFEDITYEEAMKKCIEFCKENYPDAPFMKELEE